MIPTKRGREKGRRNKNFDDANSMQPEMPTSTHKMSSGKKRQKKDAYDRKEAVEDQDEEDKHSDNELGANINNENVFLEEDFESPDKAGEDMLRLGDSNSRMGKRLRQENGLVELTKKFI